jgi:quinol monooxygenase YgiN
MHFVADQVENFKIKFEGWKNHIRNQEGCLYLELIQDINDPQSFYTYSHWQDETALNKYRNGALFKEVWPATKAMFDRKPQATSLTQLHSLK